MVLGSTEEGMVTCIGLGASWATTLPRKAEWKTCLETEKKNNLVRLEKQHRRENIFSSVLLVATQNAMCKNLVCFFLVQATPEGI